VVTTKKHFASDDEGRSYQSEALKALTLGVPAGWNKPANNEGVGPAERLGKPTSGERQE